MEFIVQIERVVSIHGNAATHISLIVTKILTTKSVTVLPHPPYSLDMTPADYFMFPKLKIALEGTRFRSVAQIKARLTAVLKTIPKEEFLASFQRALQSLHRRGLMYVEN